MQGLGINACSNPRLSREFKVENTRNNMIVANFHTKRFPCQRLWSAVVRFHFCSRGKPHNHPTHFPPSNIPPPDNKHTHRHHNQLRTSISPHFLLLCRYQNSRQCCAAWPYGQQDRSSPLLPPPLSSLVIFQPSPESTNLAALVMPYRTLHSPISRRDGSPCLQTSRLICGCL